MPCELRARFLAWSGPSKTLELRSFCRRSLRKRRCVPTFWLCTSLLKLTDSVWQGLKSLCLTAWRAASTTSSFITSTAVVCCVDIWVARSIKISEGLASIWNLIWTNKIALKPAILSAKQCIYLFLCKYGHLLRYWANNSERTHQIRQSAAIMLYSYLLGMNDELILERHLLISLFFSCLSASGDLTWFGNGDTVTNPRQLENNC